MAQVVDNQITAPRTANNSSDVPTRERETQTTDNPSSSPETHASQDRPQENRAITEQIPPLEGNPRGQTPESNRPESENLEDGRRAALQAFPCVGRVDPHWVECVACEKIVKLGCGSYSPSNLERHMKSKAHLNATTGATGPPVTTSTIPPAEDHVEGRPQRTRASSNRQSRRKVLATKPLARPSNRRGDRNKSKGDAGTTMTAKAPSHSSEHPPRREQGAPDTSAIRFQAGASGRMEGTVTVDGQRRKVIECTISEGFAPKRMDISLTF